MSTLEPAPPLLCRSCGAAVTHLVADLGTTPLANSYVAPADRFKAEPFFALTLYLCAGCLLAQIPAVESPQAIFGDYAYFSSYSESWLDHARRYAAAMIERFALGAGSRVVEVASNDGYLLRFFQERGVPVLSVEPAANVAAAAEAAGIPTRVAFFGLETARALAAEGWRADLVAGNNVLAHVPDLNDFVAGLALLLAPGGVLTLEFPHLVRLVEGNQFDTIYHEHFSYFSFLAVEGVLRRHGLALFDVEELPTHGGSLRVYAQHGGGSTQPPGAQPPGTHPVTPRVAELLARERAAGVDGLDYYRSFGERVRETKRKLLTFLIDARRRGRSVAGYGAPAKGNTLLNYCGIGTDLLDYTVDRSPHKQGRYLPGSRIPIHPPEHLAETRPDYVLILPWNLRDEITAQMAEVRTWGGRFVVAIPEVTVLD